MAGKPLHPALKVRAQAVRHAHAHLSATVPGFRQLSGADQLKATQMHVGRDTTAYVERRMKGGR